MATAQTTALAVERREVAGSRAARRLRRTGNVPGIVDGAGGTPVVVKELIRHPVSGETIHIDMLRVRLDVAIGATVVLDLVGAEDAPGVKEGGVLEQVTRELNIEALPGDIPDVIQHDVSGVQIGDTITLDAVSAPRGV